MRHVIIHKGSSWPARALSISLANAKIISYCMFACYEYHLVIYIPRNQEFLWDAIPQLNGPPYQEIPSATI